MSDADWKQRYIELKREYTAYKKAVQAHCNQQEHALEKIVQMQANDALQRVRLLKEWKYEQPKQKTIMQWSSK